MKQDDIIQMAREAGWTGIYSQWVSPTEREHLTVPVTIEQIERFAQLVAAHEREECAKVAEAERMEGPAPVGLFPPQIIEAVEVTCRQTGRSIAEKIRARGNK